MSAYDPLHEPGKEYPAPYSLDIEITATRRILDETAGLNIHSYGDMLHAAVSLNTRVRQLLAAIDAERGER
ncbi:hypothetical protein [Streptomyces sp. NPDC007905]|uniref:hypothetical protein n=1 Tax=Streptomyces sp. NPDC007905 TaxID=3364788 RepID=UPI0036EB475F